MGIFKKIFREKAAASTPAPDAGSARLQARLAPAPVAPARPVVSSLERWVRSGQPREWVSRHRAQWNHDDWLTLLRELERSEFWPLDPNEVGAVLESLKAEHSRLEAATV